MAKVKKNFNPDVTVIIPMYNAAEYVEQCLQSLLDQTLGNIEVIVVDDCSTDDSVAVVKNFAPNFEGRLNLIKLSKNSGHASFPRNQALKHAHGKYIYYLDSDDFIEKTALEEFFKVAEDFDADVVHSEKFFVYYSSGENYKNQVETFQEGEFVTEPTLETFDLGQRVNDFIAKHYLWWGCNKLFRRQFLIDNKIKFPAMTSFEDYVFAFQCVVAAKNYVRVPFISYYYRMHDDSLAHKRRAADEIILNMTTAVSTMDNFMLARKYFHDNPQARFALIDFFAQWRIDDVADINFITSGIDLPEIFVIYYNNVFAKKSGENAALLTDLFINTSIYRMHTKQLQKQVAELEAQLAKLQS